MSNCKVKWQVSCITAGKNRSFQGTAGLGNNESSAPPTLATWLIGILEMLERAEHLEDADEFQIIAAFKK